MTTDDLIEEIEQITSQSELDFIAKSSFYSIWDLLKILQQKHNKFKVKMGRFEWVKSLSERIESGSSEEIYGLVKEIEIQDLSNSDKAYLKIHFDFPFYNEIAYKRNRVYREKYDQKLLEFSECLNDDGITNLAENLIGMSLEEFEREFEQLSTTISVITQLLTSVLENKPHLRTIMKGQLREICFRCKQVARRKAEKLRHKMRVEKREEIREREGSLRLKPITYSYLKRDFLRKSDFECLRELFNLEKSTSNLDDFISIKKNNKDALIFSLSGKIDCESLQRMKSFIDLIDSMYVPRGVEVRHFS